MLSVKRHNCLFARPPEEHRYGQGSGKSLICFTLTGRLDAGDVTKRVCYALPVTFYHPKPCDGYPNNKITALHRRGLTVKMFQLFFELVIVQKYKTDHMVASAI